MDAAGNVYIADTGNDRIREVDAVTHIITTVAGNPNSINVADGIPATDAEIIGPVGVALDDAGNLFISDPWLDHVREVNASHRHH